ncbi:MAG: hypothetical protein LBJ00_06310 [Planctomycetaceae bacterium]|nr:hypothetical protein [Planctomycetaceae bacterium]
MKRLFRGEAYCLTGYGISATKCTKKHKRFHEIPKKLFLLRFTLRGL